jgi:hypothetical protein
MRSSLGTACFLGTLFYGMAALAATIQPVQGDLSVNQGQGFQKVNGRIEAKVGDSAMVSPGGSATVTYPDGCKVGVKPGAVVTIAPLSPCASGSYAADLGLPPPVYKAPPVAVPPPVDWVPFAVGAALIGTGIGLCVAFCGHHHHAASP